MVNSSGPLLRLASAGGLSIPQAGHWLFAVATHSSGTAALSPALKNPSLLPPPPQPPKGQAEGQEAAPTSNSPRRLRVSLERSPAAVDRSARHPAYRPTVSPGPLRPPRAGSPEPIGQGSNSRGKVPSRSRSASQPGSRHRQPPRQRAARRTPAADKRGPSHTAGGKRVQLPPPPTTGNGGVAVDSNPLLRQAPA